MTGHKGPAIVIGKKSGKDNIKDYLDKLGLSADNDQVTRILDLVVKEKAYEVNRVLNDDEFRVIHKEATGGR